MPATSHKVKPDKSNQIKSSLFIHCIFRDDSRVFTVYKKKNYVKIQFIKITIIYITRQSLKTS